MKIKTADLIGKPLDWAVASCHGHEDETILARLEPDEEGWFINYSEDWAQGGPVIERERIFLVPSFIEGDPASVWGAEKYDRYQRPAWFGDGPTPLIAAMRCYVASKLGEEVEVPEELFHYAWCAPCEGEKPMIDGGCAVCGHTEGAPA